MSKGSYKNFLICFAVFLGVSVLWLFLLLNFCWSALFVGNFCSLQTEITCNEDFFGRNFYSNIWEHVGWIYFVKFSDKLVHLNSPKEKRNRWEYFLPLNWLPKINLFTAEPTKGNIFE